MNIGDGGAAKEHGTAVTSFDEIKVKNYTNLDFFVNRDYLSAESSFLDEDLIALLLQHIARTTPSDNLDDSMHVVSSYKKFDKLIIPQFMQKGKFYKKTT